METLTPRQEMLIKLSAEILNELNLSDLSLSIDLQERLKYDWAEQDIWCLADDLLIEFWL